MADFKRHLPRLWVLGAPGGAQKGTPLLSIFGQNGSKVGSLFRGVLGGSERESWQMTLEISHFGLRWPKGGQNRVSLLGHLGGQK